MEIGERKQKILSAVVREYVETIRPIGSEDLASRYSAWGVKSATIRNELAELAELGLLRQPHTSAGRIPSDQGYRFYVDNLMEVHPVDEYTNAINEIDTTLELERLLRQTCALLTRMTSYTSVATPPRPADTELSQVFISPVGDNRLLVAILLSTGQIENRLISESKELKAGEIVTLTNALNSAFVGKTLDSIASNKSIVDIPNELPVELRTAFSSLSTLISQCVFEISHDNHVFLEGATEILKQPEFRDVSKLEGVLETLQHGALMFHMASRMRSQLTVVIGAENHVVTMQECSVITAPYYVGVKQRGTIGVVGPTRMNYDRTVPAVNLFAQALSKTLTHLSA